MGIEPFLMSASTVGVMAQRLARRLCQKCKEPWPTMTPADTWACHAVPQSTRQPDAKPGGKGVKGRIGIYEVLKMNAEIRQMVAKGADAEEIHQAAVRCGMIDLKAYSCILLLNGDTSVEEILQVVSVQD